MHIQIGQVGPGMESCLNPEDEFGEKKQKKNKIAALEAGASGKANLFIIENRFILFFSTCCMDIDATDRRAHAVYNL